MLGFLLLDYTLYLWHRANHRAPFLWRFHAVHHVDLDLDTNGEVAGIPNASFSDAKQLGAILAQSRVCQECIIRQIFRYAFGRMETSADEDTIHQLFDVFRDSGFRFSRMSRVLLPLDFPRKWLNIRKTMSSIDSA